MIDLNNFEFSIDGYEGEIEFEGQTILLFVFAEEGEEVVDTNTHANKALTWATQNYQAAIDYAVQELLELKNQAWLEEDEEPITADTFKTALTLIELSFHDDQSITFTFDDGDLFWGHFVTISTDHNRTFISAEIEG